VEQPTPQTQDSDLGLSVPPSDCTSHASYDPQTQTSMAVIGKNAWHSKPKESDGNEIIARESDRRRSMTETGSSRNDIVSNGVKRCDSASPVYITVNVTPHSSPARSGHCESLQKENEYTPNSNLSPNDSSLNNTSFQSQNPSDLLSLSEPSDSSERNAAPVERVEDHGLVMKPSPNNEEPAQSTIPPPNPHLHTNSTTGLQKDESFWKWKNKWRGCRWSTQNTWSIKREQLLNDIWFHQDLNYIKSPQRIPVDIDCGPHSPHLSLFVYPFGLFEDRNKSMTLMVKVTVPDECPPIPSKETFELMWGVSIAAKEEPRTLDNSKKPVKIKFKVGVKYIHKFLSHKALQMNNCERLEVRVHVSTNYSVCSTYPCQSEGTDL
jgi:hypothetical protein